MISDEILFAQYPVFPVKFQLGGLYPLLPKNGGIKKKIRVQNRSSMDTKLLKSH